MYSDCLDCRSECRTLWRLHTTGALFIINELALFVEDLF